MSAVRRPVLIGAGAVLAVVAILLISLAVTVRRPLPAYNGEEAVPGLQGKVTVQRDAQGVPQISAGSAADLFYAQGYVQASDRFFQMDVRRHLASGRLAELIGDRNGALDSDKAVRTMGWRRVAEAELPLLSPQTRNNLQAFADGVNGYLDSRSPNELSINYVVLESQVDIKRVEPWTPVDSLVWLKAMAWDLRGSYDNELGRALAYGQVNNVGLVNQLYPAYPANGPTILPATVKTDGAPVRATGSTDDGSTGDGSTDDEPTPASSVLGGRELAGLQRALDSVGGGLGTAPALGSNSWVVSGEHTTSGKPMLAADPHLTPSMPGALYQVGLHCTKVTAECPYQVSGFALPGGPGVLFGQNAKIGWALTNLPVDTTDLFLEKVVGDGYVVGTQTRPLTTRSETIRVAGADDVKIDVRSTEHGPLLSDVVSRVLRAGAAQPGTTGPVQGDYDVALAWTGLTPGRTMDAIFGLNAATDWSSFRSALARFDLPPMNALYADTEGQIGYQAAGRIPTRSGGGLGQSTGEWPRQGWDPSWNWGPWVETAALPSSLNPSDGLIVAANQKISPDTSLTGDWDYGFRADRIEKLLRTRLAEHKLTPADHTAIQMDTYSAYAANVWVPVLRRAPITDEETSRAKRAFTAEAVSLLDDWDGRFTADSAAAAYYGAVWSNLLRLTFNDQLPSGVSLTGDSRSMEVLRTLPRNSQWWDDVSTPTIVETREQIIARSLVEARLELTARIGKDPERWQWGKLHTMTAVQFPLGQSYPSVIERMVNSPTVAVPGAADTIDVGAWTASSDSYKATTIPAVRMVVDLGAPDQSTWVDSSGISAHPWSGHYGDQSDRWRDGEPYPWPVSRKAIDEAADATLTLVPRKGEAG